MSKHDPFEPFCCYNWTIVKLDKHQNHNINTYILLTDYFKHGNL